MFDNNHNRGLVTAIDKVVEHLRKIVINKRFSHHDMVVFFELFYHFDQFLFAKTQSGLDITKKPFSVSNLKGKNVETFGVYKYFTNNYQKAESNYYVINLNGMTVIDGQVQYKTLYLNDLLDLKLIVDDSNDPRRQNGIYLSLNELLIALTGLIDHFEAIKNFL